MAVCDDWEFVLAVSADYPDMLDAAQLHSVHIVNQAVVGKRFQLRTCDRIRYFKDNRLISLFCNPRFQHGIENIRACLRIVDVQNKEIKEIQISDMDLLSPMDIEEYLSYLQLYEKEGKE